MTEPSRTYIPYCNWSSRAARVPSIDGLRAVSVLIVLVGHMLLPARFVGLSAIGLKLFFMISGFLITRLLLAEHKAEGRISLRTFYARRILRLYPVIIVYVLLAVVVKLGRSENIPLKEIASVFFYFVNYLVIQYDSVDKGMALPVNMLWSLSVEEHFYLLAPMALVLMKGDARKLLFSAIFVCFFSLGLRIAYAYWSPGIVQTLELYWRSETRFDCIAYGVILACLPELSRGQKILRILAHRSIFIAATLLFLFSFLLRDQYYQMTWRFSVQGIALIPMMAGVIFSEPFPLINKVLNCKSMIWIGALSYSLYVWHGGVMFLMGKWISQLPGFWPHTVEFLCAFIFAIFSYYLVERPVLRVRDKMKNRRERRFLLPDQTPKS